MQYRRYRVDFSLVTHTVTTAPAPEPIPRTPRGEVRDRILAAAEAEFLQSGYRGASLVGIARRAGFTKGAVYSNFASKQALLATILTARSERLGRMALEKLTASRSDAADLARRAGRLLADEMAADRDWNVLILELAVHAVSDPEAARSYAEFRAAQRDTLADALAAAIPALGISADADVRAAAFTLVTMISALALESVADPGAMTQFSAADVFATVVAALIEGAAS